MWFSQLSRRAYEQLEAASIESAREVRRLYRAGQKQDAYALFLTDPLGNGLSFEEWDAAMQRALERERPDRPHYDAL